MSINAILSLMDEIELQQAEICLCDSQIGLLRDSTLPRDRQLLASYVGDRARHAEKLRVITASLARLEHL